MVLVLSFLNIAPEQIRVVNGRVFAFSPL